MTRKAFTTEQKIENFWNRTEVSTENFYNGTPCIEWQTGLSAKGYGLSTKILGETRVHRIAWTLEHGKIEGNFQIDHLCRNRKCLNVNHLDLVTNEVNTQRGDSASLTAEDVLAIRELYATGKYAQSFLAGRFNVTQFTINQAVTGKQWKNVGGPITIAGSGRRRIDAPEWVMAAD